MFDVVIQNILAKQVDEINVRSDTKRGSLMVVFLGTNRNKGVSFRISEKQETTKVVSTISAYRQVRVYPVLNKKFD